MSEGTGVMEDWEAWNAEQKLLTEGVEARLEPGVVGFSGDKALASIAISLKRIADALQPTCMTGAGMTGAANGVPLWYDHRSPSYGIIGGAGG